MSEALKPCPSCGGKSESCGYPGLGGSETFRCADKECPAYDLLATAEEWNTRAIETQLLEALERINDFWLDDFPGGPGTPSRGGVSLAADTVTVWEQIQAAIKAAKGES